MNRRPGRQERSPLPRFSIEKARASLVGSRIKSDRTVLDEQIDYYRARAPEYDEWFLRRGRYDRGEEPKREWFEEVGKVREALDRFAPRGEALELACGTGLWTERLAGRADRLLALDASPEMIALNRARLGAAENVEYVEADLFTWRPDRRFDVVFFAFWLSHVPEEKFDAFWEMVGEALKPAGRVFLVDSLYNPTSTASDHRLPDRRAGSVKRKLNDRREYSIVKTFHEPEELAARLANLGWRFTFEQTRDYFMFGGGAPI